MDTVKSTSPTENSTRHWLLDRAFLPADKLSNLLSRNDETKKPFLRLAEYILVLQV